MKAPFPYFGKKDRVADVVWERFGNVPNYVEPFFGSGAVLLARPHEPGLETVNDIDVFLANFWRAVKADPAKVAEYADWPVNEADTSARHLWLVKYREEMRERISLDPDAFDAKVAGWWVWGLSLWLASAWCSGDGPWTDDGNGHWVKVPASMKRLGIVRGLPHMTPRGVNRRTSPNDKKMDREALIEWMAELQSRLRRVRVCSGDWSRVVTKAVTTGLGLTGVFLDPPYDLNGRAKVYAHDTAVAASVRTWAIKHGDNPDMRIALCGYEGVKMPSTWETYAWAAGGYGAQGMSSGRRNGARERIWFSPHCLKDGEHTPHASVRKGPPKWLQSGRRRR